MSVRISKYPAITPDDAGVWLDGRYGWHNAYRVIERAGDYGFVVPDEYSEALLRFIVNIDVSDTDHEAITGHGELSDMATDHLNDLAPDGYSFVWNAGELSLMSNADAEMI